MTKKEYVSPKISGRTPEGEFIIPAIAAAAVTAAKALVEDNFSAIDVEPLPACITA